MVESPDGGLWPVWGAAVSGITLSVDGTSVADGAPRILPVLDRVIGFDMKVIEMIPVF